MLKKPDKTVTSVKTRNVSKGHRCPHFSTYVTNFWTVRWKDKSQSKCQSIKIFQQVLYLSK